MKSNIENSRNFVFVENLIEINFHIAGDTAPPKLPIIALIPNSTPRFLKIKLGKKKAGSVTRFLA